MSWHYLSRDFASCHIRTFRPPGNTTADSSVFESDNDANQRRRPWQLNRAGRPSFADTDIRGSAREIFVDLAHRVWLSFYWTSIYD